MSLKAGSSRGEYPKELHPRARRNPRSPQNPTSAKEQLEVALKNEDVNFTGVEEARAALADL